jgi:hypothetical protein
MKLASSLALVLLVSVAPAIASADVSADVRAVFARYCRALKDRKGAAAAAEVDDATLRYYDGLRALALGAPEAKVRKLAIGDKLTVLRLRLDLPADQLTAMDGRALVSYVLDKGWGSSDQIANATLGPVKVTGGKAEAPLVLAGKPSSTTFVFRKQKDAWRIDLTSFNAPNNRQLQELARRQKLGEDEMAEKVLERVMGRPVPKKMWEPLVAKGR